MAKVTFEFDDNEERSDIEEVVNRSKIMCALRDLSDLYRRLYNREREGGHLLFQLFLCII